MKLHAILALLLLGLAAPLQAHPESDWKAANQAYQSHSYRSALESYRLFLRGAKPKDPRRQAASLRVATCYGELKEPARQREWLEDWLRKAPSDLETARGCLMLAPLLELQNQRQLQLYTRAIDILEPRQDGLEELVRAYTARAGLQSVPRESERDLRRAMQVDPRARYSGQAFLDLADSYRYRGDSRVRALEVLHELGVLRAGTPEGSQAMLEEARILDDLERYAEALEMVQALERSAPDRPETIEARSLRDAILSPLVELSGEPLDTTLSLRTRNVTRVHLAVYPVDLLQLFRQHRTLDPAQLPVSGRPLAEQSLAVSVLRPHAFYEARLPVPVKESGAYLVQASSGGKTAATLVLRSKVRLFSVGGEGAPGVLWLLRSDKGTPVARAEILQGYNSSEASGEVFERVRPLRILEGGLVALEPARYPSLVVARVGDDYAWAEVEPADPGRREGFVFTDRPFYRPGQKVEVQAVLRVSLGGDALRSPSGQPFRVRIVDPQGNRLLDNTRNANASGVVGSEVTLAPEAALGNYHVEVLQGHESWAVGAFRVEEYLKPEFVVRAEPEQPLYDAGQAARMKLTARYFSGEPLAKARVSWKVIRREVPAPSLGRPGVGWFQARREAGGAGAAVVQGSGRLDEEGSLLISIPTRLSEAHPDELYRYELSAEVTDEGRRTFPGQGTLMVSTRGAFLRVASARQFWQANALVELQAEAVDPLGKPLDLRGDYVVSRWHNSRYDPVDKGTVKLQEGRGGWTWQATRPGSYRLELRAEDANHRPVTASTTFQVGSEGRLFDFSGVQALPDKEFYRCGELAEVVINTRKPGMDVLLLLGNYQAARRMVVHCPTRTTRVQIPIGPDLSPGFSLRARAWQDGDWLESERVLEVANTPGVLTLKLEPSPARQGPGEEGKLAMTVTDDTGTPAIADLVVSVVDASVWEVAERDPRSLVQAFYGSRPVGPPPLEMPELQLREGRLREYSPETALFKTLHTGPDGRATVAVPYPDSLTTWNIVVRAFTPDSRFGQAQTSVAVSKDLLVRLAAPRFLTEKDDVTLNVQVQNNFSQAQTTTVTLQAQGGAPESSPEQSLAVPARSQKSQDFPMSVTREGWLVLTATARAPLESDTFKRKLPVLPHGNPVQETKSGEFQRQATIELKVPRERNRASTRLEVRVSATLAGPVVRALETLLDSPYGCVEQTLSRFVPAACVARAMRELDLHDDRLTHRVPQVMQVGLSRLASFQHPDGGWGWWKNDPTDPLMTAYVVYGLTLAEQAGYQISQPMLQRGRDALRQTWERFEPSSLAWACLALSLTEQAPDAALDKAFSARGRLSLSERFLLAQALARQKRIDEARTLLAEARDSWQNDSFGDDVETNAAALLAYQRLGPEDEHGEKLARWLLNHRQGSGWDGTRASALAVLSLLEPLKKERKPSAMRYGVFLNGSEVDTRTVSPEDWWREQSTQLKSEQVPAGDLKLELVAQGNVSGYWSTVLRYTTPEESLQAAGRDLTVRRRYFRVDRAGRTEPLHSGKAVRSGDELIVVLDLECKSACDYLVLEDYRPAGCEAVGLSSGSSYRFCSNVEVRDELTAFFVSHLPPGKSQLSYRLRAEIPGRFHAMPARLYGMYAPGLQANSEEMQLGIVP